jgi:Flp pilus assembly pilin Flp
VRGYLPRFAARPGGRDAGQFTAINKYSTVVSDSCPSEYRNGFDMSHLLHGIRFDRSGATAIEYAMVAFFISIAAFSVIFSTGGSVSGLFQSIANSF